MTIDIQSFMEILARASHTRYVQPHLTTFNYVLESAVIPMGSKSINHSISEEVGKCLTLAGMQWTYDWQD